MTAENYAASSKSHAENPLRKAGGIITATSTFSSLLPCWSASTADVANPQASIIQVIHRGTDGYVTFNRIDQTASDEGWIDIGSVRVSALVTTVPTITHELADNAYFSINSTYRGGYWENESTGLPHTLRGEEHLRWLNANYADLDCYKRGLNFYETFAGILKAADERLIPPPSLICRSGKGIWLFWLLHTTGDRGLPVRAFKPAIELYRDTQQAIVDRLQHLGADKLAKDAARITRVPGSLNMTAGPGFRRVTYWQQHDSTGAPYSYTQMELATWFGVTPRSARISLPSRPAYIRRSPLQSTKPELSEIRRRGWVARWAEDRSAFETLRRLRGGFRKSHRNHAAFIYAILLRKQGVKAEEIERLVCQLGAECVPALPASRCRYVTYKVLEKYSNWHISRTTMINLLAVTEAETKHLPQWFPPPTKPKRRPAAERRAMIQAEVERRGIVPSCSEMAQFLGDREFKVTKRSVALDYKKLALISSGRAGRPKNSKTVNDR